MCLGVLLLLDEHVDKDSIRTFPLARYAAEHWVSHARFKDVSTRIKNGMRLLFDTDKPHFAAWLWIPHLAESMGHHELAQKLLVYCVAEVNTLVYYTLAPSTHT